MKLDVDPHVGFSQVLNINVSILNTYFVADIPPDILDNYGFVFFFFLPTQEHVFEARFNPGSVPRNICDQMQALKEMFDHILARAKRGKKPGDRMRINIDHRYFLKQNTIELLFEAM